MKKQIKRSLAIALASELDNLIKEPGMKMASRIEVRRTQNAIKGEVDSYNELRDDLLKELGEEHETEKGSFSVKKENMESFVSQIQECLDAEVEITVLFTLESLKDIKSETENHYGAIIDLLL